MSEVFAHPASHHHDDTVGRHGMLVFGEQVLYFSHLPMFHAPHNFQVLLEVRLGDDATQALFVDRRLNPAEIYTFDPEEFAIAELDPSGPVRPSIRGTLVHGHFERGGEPIATEVTAEVVNVLYFNRFDVDAERPDGELMRYLCFGRPGQLFLAHRIEGRPSFDHVVFARMVPGTVTNQAGTSLDEDVDTIGYQLAQPVEVGRRELTDLPLAEDETFTGRFGQTVSLTGAHGFRVDLEVGAQVYLERDELR
jgi:hypothetical protein